MTETTTEAERIAELEKRVESLDDQLTQLGLYVIGDTAWHYGRNRWITRDTDAVTVYGEGVEGWDTFDA